MKYGREDLELFDIHMLLELDGLKEGISFEPAGFPRETLKLVLSSILVKVSRQPGDTVERIAPRRLASGFAIRLFGNKTEELARRLQDYATLLPAAAPEARFAVDDARELGWVSPRSVDLVLSSPPYPGVYDYALHHATRLRWLGLDARPFETREIGARRHVRAASRYDAIESWRRDFGESLRAIRGVLAPRGAAVLSHHKQRKKTRQKRPHTPPPSPLPQTPPRGFLKSPKTKRGKKGGEGRRGKKSKTLGRKKKKR